MVDVSNYAAQIGWWLNFFAPDRFIVISSADLRSNKSQVEVRMSALQVAPLVLFLS